MKILLYNNYPFHHELIGFGLDYCRKRNYQAIVYNPNDYDKYMEFYKKCEYDYTMIDKIEEPEQYDLIILLSDCERSFIKEWVTSKTICINHWYCKRNPFITKQIPIAPFKSTYYNPDFIIPVHPVISKDSKIKILPVTEIVITIMGRFIPDSLEYLDFINKNDNNVYYNIISRSIHPSLKNHKNVILYQNIDALMLYTVLANSHYVLITDMNHYHNKGITTSASISCSFSTGCQLIIPEEMNKHLRLKSAILYDRNKPLALGSPNLDLVYQEHDEIINTRDRILDEII